jgi:hypothetical protein
MSQDYEGVLFFVASPVISREHRRTGVNCHEQGPKRGPKSPNPSSGVESLPLPYANGIFVRTNYDRAEAPCSRQSAVPKTGVYSGQTPYLFREHAAAALQKWVRLETRKASVQA